jgi:hypothetical protein
VADREKFLFDFWTTGHLMRISAGRGGALLRGALRHDFALRRGRNRWETGQTINPAI